MYFPPLERIPDGATEATRRRMYLKFVVRLVAMYPNQFLPVGVRKRWWHWRIEHPLTNERDVQRIQREGR